MIHLKSRRINRLKHLESSDSHPIRSREESANQGQGQAHQITPNSADGIATDAETVNVSYSDGMDYLEALREKIGHLRGEIAEIQDLNKRYRLRDRNDRDAQIAHGQRHERLQAIQQELAQLATLGSRVRSVEEMKERHRSRLLLVKQAS